MKILIIILLYALPVSVLTVAWDEHTDTRVLGYTLYWQEQGTTEEWRIDLPLRTTTQYVIEDKFLKIDKIYDIWATAYTDKVNSDKSEVITATRSITFSPPSSNLPTVEYEPTKPTKIIINATP